jgi:hypothetical protein
MSSCGSCLSQTLLLSTRWRSHALVWPWRWPGPSCGGAGVHAAPQPAQERRRSHSLLPPTSWKAAGFPELLSLGLL